MRSPQTQNTKPAKIINLNPREIYVERLIEAFRLPNEDARGLRTCAEFLDAFRFRGIFIDLRGHK